MKGFTLIELLISISIMAILVTGAVSNYNRYNSHEKIQQTALNLQNDLRYAQNQAVSGVKPSGCTTLVGYEVRFLSSTQYSSQADCQPEGLVSPASTVTLSNGVVIVGSPSDILFGVLSRGTLTADTNIIFTDSSSSYYYEVTVSQSGNINSGTIVSITPTPTP